MKTVKVVKTKVGIYTVSTIHIVYDEMPDHYETIVFKKVGKFRGGLGTEVHCARWTTESIARRGHEELVNKLKDGWRP